MKMKVASPPNNTEPTMLSKLVWGWTYESKKSELQQPRHKLTSSMKTKTLKMVMYSTENTTSMQNCEAVLVGSILIFITTHLAATA